MGLKSIVILTVFPVPPFAPYMGLKRFITEENKNVDVFAPYMGLKSNLNISL